MTELCPWCNTDPAEAARRHEGRMRRQDEATAFAIVKEHILRHRRKVPQLLPRPPLLPQPRPDFPPEYFADELVEAIVYALATARGETSKAVIGRSSIR